MEWDKVIRGLTGDMRQERDVHVALRESLRVSLAEGRAHRDALRQAAEDARKAREARRRNLL